MRYQNFNELIHAERGKLLRRLPPGAKTVCSAGCSGRWYFNWIEKNYGPIDRHIGVELFSPKPDDLPDNVQWIQNSVSQMLDVPSGSVDLLISGQNIEHLYYEDLLGFLQEANRVTRLGGHICLDSPNRLITQDAGYIQPQHVLELSAPEAIELIEAAGFSMVDVHGIWNCTEGVKRFGTTERLPANFYRQLLSAHDEPANSFIWWIVAEKTGPARNDLEDLVDKIVTRSFKPFAAARFRKRLGRVHSIEGTETILELSESDRGCVFYGPWVPLRAGRHRVEFDLKFLNAAGAVQLDVVSHGATREVAKTVVNPEVLGEWQKQTLEFELGDYTEGIETRAITFGANALIRFGSQIMRV